MAAGTRKTASATSGAGGRLATAAETTADLAGDAKSERLNLRLSVEQKRCRGRAQPLAKPSLTDFVLSTVAHESHRIIGDWELIRLSDRDRDLFLAALDHNDARPLPGLRRAAARHKKALG